MRHYYCSLLIWCLALLLANKLSCVNAHEHMNMTPVQWSEAELQPIDTWLKLHIIFMLVAFGGLFPLGIILGVTKHRFHVPIQIIAIILTTLGILLGHVHGGRVFPHSAHGTGANWVVLMIIVQAGIGVFLKRYRQPTVYRLVAKTGHKVIGLGWFVMGGVQCGLGLITYMGYCGGTHTNNCLAHEIMGSSIAAYGIGVHITSSGAGRRWLRRLANGCVNRISKARGSAPSLSLKSRSVDWVDAWLITVWGVFNTFTEHRWGQSWNHTDLQHTSMGVLWWAGGAAALFSLLHRPDQRTPLPALVIFFTGAGMVAHHQHMAIGVTTHAWFGKALMAAAVARLIEMALEEGGLGKTTAFNGNYRAASGGDMIPHKYQENRVLPMLRRLSGLSMVISGLLFCGSTEEALASVAGNGLDVVTYMNGIISLGLALLAYVEGLIYVYKQCRIARRKQLGLPKAQDDEDEDEPVIYDTALLSAGHSVVYNQLRSPPPSAGTHVLFNDDDNDNDDNDDNNGRYRRQQAQESACHATTPSNIQVITEEHEMESRN